jgi:hypothetical protein
MQTRNQPDRNARALEEREICIRFPSSACILVQVLCKSTCLLRSPYLRLGTDELRRRLNWCAGWWLVGMVELHPVLWVFPIALSAVPAQPGFISAHACAAQRGSTYWQDGFAVAPI